MYKSVDNLNLAVVPLSFLNKLENDVNELKSLIKTKSEQEMNSLWIESVKIPKLLGISTKTWQTYRDKRLIPFSQVGSKIYVKRADLEEFMNSHIISKRKG